MQRLVAYGETPAAAALDRLASSMELGLLLLDAQGHPVFANRIALDLLGCDVPGLVSAWPVLRAAMHTGPACDNARTFTAEFSVDGNTRFLRGEIRDSEEVSEIFLKDRRRLGALDLELLSASRMKEWVHQSEALVHDANGALNTIQLTLELLDGQWPGPNAPNAGVQVHEPRRRDHAGVIRDNLGKLKLILRQFLEAGDGNAGAPVDVREIFKEAETTLRMPARRRRIELQIANPPAAAMVRGRRSRVRQALVNVVLARIAAAPERSRVELEAIVTSEGVELICRDAGSLPEAERAAIFGVVLSERIAGVDLRIARALIEAECGEFEVSEMGGTGTAIRFVFPSA